MARPALGTAMVSTRSEIYNWKVVALDATCYPMANRLGKKEPMPAKATTRKRKGAPEWSTNPFRQFLDDADRLQDVVGLSSTGISMIRSIPQAIEALTKAGTHDASEGAEKLEAAKKAADLAKREVESGFPILHAWAVVGLWALFEATIRTFVAEWLKHKRTAWKIDEVRGLNIKLGDYEALPRDQRHRYVVELLEAKLGSRLTAGVTRFEALLAPFGLSGELPERLKREIYELGQVRNLIAHNASKVDRRFVDACPWLDSKVGDEFYVSREMLQRYFGATVSYVTLIICRLGEHFGLDMSEDRISIVEKWE